MSLNTPQIRTLRLIKRAASVYLLLRLVQQPLRQSDIAHLLDLHPQTVRQCLRLLAENGLISHVAEPGTYGLTPAGRAFLLEGEAKIAPSEDIIINTASESPLPSSTPAAVIRPAQAKIASQAASEAIWQAFREVGITPNRRTLRLASLPHIHPDYVTAHYLQLKRLGKAHQTGLLITILEAGVPAPPLNANRHLKDCDCEACRRLRYATCWTCGQSPCICEADED